MIDEVMNLNGVELPVLPGQEEEEYGLERSEKRKEKKLTEAQLKEKMKKAEDTIDAYASIFLAEPTEKHFQELWKRSWWGLRQHAFKILKDNDTTEEIVIQVLEKVWNKHHQYNPEKAKFSTWMYRICRNQALQYLECKAKERTVDNDISDLYNKTLYQNGQSDAFCDDAHKMSDKFDTTENGDLIMVDREHIIAKLYDTSVGIINSFKESDPKVYNCMVEKHLNGMKLCDIGKKYGYPLSSVKNWIHKGKMKMNDEIRLHHRELLSMWNEVM